MTEVINFTQTTDLIRKQIRIKIKQIIDQASAFGAFCAGSYLRQVLIYSEDATNQFSSVDLYFSNTWLIIEFEEFYKDQLIKVNDELILSLYGINLTKVKCKLISDYEINFDIDRLVYQHGVFRFIDDNLMLIKLPIIDELQNKAFSKKATIKQSYCDYVHKTHDVSAVNELLSENYDLIFPSGVVRCAGGISMTHEEFLIAAKLNNPKDKLNNPKDKLNNKDHLIKVLEETLALLKQ